jgi:zinc/manganese transport system permease protein
VSDAFSLLLWPMLACLVLTGIHAYLGLHVVERGVIFVDLSLAQIAALGATIAYLVGYDVHGRSAYYFSLAFTLLGAAIFALTRAKRSKVPQEAIIGIVYAVSAAAAVLVMDRLPEGAEHIKDSLVGNLLAVMPHQVIKMAILYSFIGLLHYLWRKPFLAISTKHQDLTAVGHHVKWWDFLFYGTFGFVVTSSVAIAGVLLVFSFLIVPSVAAMLYARTIGKRLAFGWTMGALVSILGIYASYKLDTPTGAMVVCMFGVVLILLALIRPLVQKLD